MITIFNRKEVFCTYDAKVQSDIRNKLADGQIDYKIKVNNRKSTSPFVAGDRARSGTFKENLDFLREYKIYVKKENFEQAAKLIHGSDR